MVVLAVVCDARMGLAGSFTFDDELEGGGLETVDG